MTTYDVVVRRRGSGEELARSTFATRPEAEAYLRRKGGAGARWVREFTVAVEVTETDDRGVRTAPAAVS